MSTMQILFIDLDDTLYPHDNGVWHAISARIQDYLIERIGFSPEEADHIRASYLSQYGTTLNGLRANHHIDPHDYLDYVHDIPLEKMLKPDERLREIFAAIPQRKIIFTNSSRQHAQRVLACLDIADQVDQVIDIISLEFVNKPDPSAYTRALALSGEPDPRTCLMLDDRVDNLLPAGQLGFTTILVGGAPHDGQVDYYLSSIHALPDILPRIEMGQTR